MIPDKITRLSVRTDASRPARDRTRIKVRRATSREAPRGFSNLRPFYSRSNEENTRTRRAGFSALRARIRASLPGCWEDPLAVTSGRWHTSSRVVGPHAALAWSRISIDIARVRSGSLNSMHRVGASCETPRVVRARNEEYSGGMC